MTAINKYSILAWCAGAVCLTACSEDTTEWLEPTVVPTQETTQKGEETTEGTITEAYPTMPNSYEYGYVMRQFAELNQDGSMAKRTRFFLQHNTQDTTALYTHIQSMSEARETFLSLLPPDQRDGITLLGDSSQMQYTFDETPLALTYSEQTDGNDVVATIGLPAAGPYNQIATSLSMVRGISALAADGEELVGTTKRIELPVLVTKTPPPFGKGNFNEGVDYYVKKYPLHMVCYKVTNDGVAKYVFIPPSPHATQLRFKDKNYLVGGIYAAAFEKGDKRKLFAKEQDKEDLMYVLPSLSELLEFTRVLPEDVIVSMVEQGTLSGDNERLEELNQMKKEGKLTDELNKEGQILNYTTAAFTSPEMLSNPNAPERYKIFALLFPFYKEDGWADFKHTVDPFSFLSAWDDFWPEGESEAQADSLRKTIGRLMSKDFYGRDEDMKKYALTESLWEDWVVLGTNPFSKDVNAAENTYQYYICPKTMKDEVGKDEPVFAPMGRNLKNTTNDILHLIYFYDEKIKK